MSSRRIEEPLVRRRPPPKMNQAEALQRRSLCLVLVLLLLSLLIVATGVYISTATESLSTSGCPSGVILRAAIFIFSLGIIVSSISLVVDGFFILPSIDVRPIRAGRCQFYSGGQGFFYENHYTTVPCQGLKESCFMMVRSGTCYCCDLYACANGGYLDKHYEFVGVQDCQEVLFVYWLVWVIAGMNLLALVLGLLTSAMLGNIKALDGGHDKDKTTEEIPLWDPQVVQNATAPLLPVHGNDSSSRLPMEQPIYQHNGHMLQPLYPVRCHISLC
ncbi:transmembrane protein 255B-like [Alosa sapidissima]|uniref:transmembrane protein 255B-like n=1 Tax=Alosa sapidissima TaxID=34773 RepID=UPI001C099956|nr:transmembrane protein 255B-like [Alosa sapidissima]